jgi:hypothetical protein
MQVVNFKAERTSTITDKLQICSRQKSFAYLSTNKIFNHEFTTSQKGLDIFKPYDDLHYWNDLS